MALSLAEFRSRLADSGLLANEAVDAFVASLPPGRAPQDAEQLARELVKAKMLTAYQAQAIYRGHGSSLVMGNYTILDKLGQGGMGVVLKAEHRRMQRIVALKVVAANFLKTPQRLERFQREVRAAARLSHPNIVAAYDADEADGVHYLVMEYVAGTDLAALVKKRGPLSVDRAVQCVLQAGLGLQYAHGQGVIHRDVKPANLLLSDSGAVKVLDMGLARIDSADTQQTDLTGSGAIVGTIDYMAPEQALSTKDADARSDIYSLGMTLYYVLTGRAAYQGDSVVSRLMAHRDAPIPSLCAIRADVPRSVDAVFQKMVAKDPADRYPCVTEVVADLQRCLSGDLPGSGLHAPVYQGGRRSAAQPEVPAEETSFARAVAETVAADAISSVDSDGRTASSGDIAKTVAMQIPAENVSGTRPHPRAYSHANPAALGGGLLVLLLAGAAGAMLLWKPMTPPAANTGSQTSQVTASGTDGAIVKPNRGPLAAAPTTEPVELIGLDFNLDLTDGSIAGCPRIKLREPIRRDQPLTVELYVTLNDLDREKGQLLFGASNRMNLVVNKGTLKWLGPSEDKRPYLQADGVLPERQRCHVAGVSTGDILRLFVDGALVAEGPVPFSLVAPPMPDFIGGFDWVSPAWDALNGVIDEVRISNVARYDGSFDPPPHLDADASTWVLYDLDEAAGTIARDLSGHGRSGEIIGARWVTFIDGTWLRSDQSERRSDQR